MPWERTRKTRQRIMALTRCGDRATALAPLLVALFVGFALLVHPQHTKGAVAPIATGNAPARLGTTQRVGHIEVTLHRVWRVPGNAAPVARVGYMVILGEMTICNRSPQPYSCSSIDPRFHIHLAGSDGRLIGPPRLVMPASARGARGSGRYSILSPGACWQFSQMLALPEAEDDVPLIFLDRFSIMEDAGMTAMAKSVVGANGSLERQGCCTCRLCSVRDPQRLR
jgi:hypothetical protein